MIPNYFTAARRRFLRRATAGGMLLASPMERLFAMAQEPGVQGLHELVGEVRVNGRVAAQGDAVAPGDTIETAAGARAIYVVDRSVFLQREQSSVELGAAPGTGNEPTDNLFVHVMRVFTGKLLSVHARGQRVVETPNGSIGIRGTGFYVDVQDGRTYACICYGVADLLTTDGEKLETVRTRHHESPRYLYPAGATNRIETAPVVDHTDAELILLESLVGRQPPFVAAGTPGSY